MFTSQGSIRQSLVSVRTVRGHQDQAFPFLLFAGLPSIVHTYVHTVHTNNTRMHTENLQVGLGMQRGSSSSAGSAHTYTHIQKKKHPPPVLCSMPEQAAPAPDAAVVFSADNLLPRMPALSFWKNSAICGPSRSGSRCPHADYVIKSFGAWFGMRASRYLESFFV